MRKLLCLFLCVLLIASAAIGCTTNQTTEEVGEATIELPTDAISVATAEPSAVPDVEDVVSFDDGTGTPIPEAEQTDSVVLAVPSPTEPVTPEPEPEPDPTPEPVPTPEPEPNPFAGIWTIEDMPFSLELRDDMTYLASIGEDEREGTYSFSNNLVTLIVDEQHQVEMHYYENVDTFKLDDFKLERDNLVFFNEIDAIPISFLNDNDDLSVSVRGGVVTVETKDGKQIQQFCFTKSGLLPSEKSRDWFDASDSGEPTERFTAFKYDGKYTLWTRDAEGNPYQSIDVTVESGFLYPIRAEGVDSVRQSVSTLLKEKGTNVDNVNRLISRDIAAAGIYTRAGVVTAGVSLISNMAKFGYSVVYQGSGSYQAARNWGINPKWGERLEKPTSDANGVYNYTGMQCVASIVWAYKQAGMNLSSEVNSAIGTLGERERSRDNRIDYDRAESGDIVKSGGHYLMIVDRLDTNSDGVDDSYLTYEMWAPHLTFLILSFRQVHGREFFSMDAFFDGTGRNAKKAFYWKNTFRIPVEDMPPYLQEAIRSEELEQNYSKLLTKLGF